MPKYQFKCPECNKTEEHESSAEQADKLVAKCAGLDDNHVHNPITMKRVYSLGGISFRGSGFYKTDNS